MTILSEPIGLNVQLWHVRTAGDTFVGALRVLVVTREANRS